MDNPIKKILIELSDSNYTIVTESELKEIEKSGEEFDGFSGVDIICEIPEFFKAADVENVIETPLAKKEERGCPCLYGTPCNEMCTCVNPTSSTGCKNCCTYGGTEQRAAKAESLKGIISLGYGKAQGLTAMKEILKERFTKHEVECGSFGSYIDDGDNAYDAIYEAMVIYANALFPTDEQIVEKAYEMYPKGGTEFRTGERGGFITGQTLLISQLKRHDFGTGNRKPKIICICGSSRFCPDIAIIKWEFEKMGHIAVGLHLLPDSYMPVKDHGAEHQGVADILDELHLRKIDLCDEVFIANVNGYIGERTAIEIKYAQDNEKIIKYLEPIS